MGTKNHIKTVLLLGALTGLLLAIGKFLGGTTGLTIAIVFSVFMNFGALFASDKIVLTLYKAQAASKENFPELHRTVEEIAGEAKIPKPRIYTIPSDASNAFAAGRSPSKAVVACTQGILRQLDKNELKGVLAHEIAHIKNRDTLITTVAATVAGVITYLAFMARFAAIFGGMRGDRDGGNVFGMLALAIVTPIIAMMLQLAISRSREYLADETGAKTIKNPGALASALAKLESSARKNPMRMGSPATSSLFIVNPFSARGLSSLFSTHPPLAKRIARLNALKI